MLNILKEAKIPKAQFTTITLRRKVTFTQQDVQLRLGITEASNELSDEDQECHDKLFSCPEDGCIKSFQRFSSLQHHLDVGRHSYALENEMLFDKAITSFATKLEQGTATVENPVEDIEACQALKSMSIQRTWLNESQKQHHTEVFQIGKRTGHKADPSYVSKPRRKARNADGSFKFGASSFLMSHHIASFFHTLLQKELLQLMSHRTKKTSSKCIQLD